MFNFDGQNYKVNRRIKEDADKNQVNYRESSDTPLTVIKRVYIYITDKKGHILPEVTLTIDGVEVKTSYNGLLISNFPNEEKTIIAEKEGYKSATTTIILNAETQTHEFFLALETDDDESEVISTDNTQPKEEFNKCGTLFELSDNNTLVVWAPSNFTNEIVDGVYTGKGSYIEQGWSNKGLWQLDYDIKYNNPSSSYVGYYVGVMPFCSEEVNPYPLNNGDNYCMESWEKWAAISGMGAACLEGPRNYKYSNQDEYHHTTIRKVTKNKIEYYFDNNKWVYLVPKLPEFETLHFGYRDNPADRSGGSTTISSKNIKVIGLCPESELLTLNDTVNLGDHYQFISYNDVDGNEEWGPGIVEIESIPEDDELYIGVKVIENEANDSFIGQIFYVKKDAQIGNNIYPLYSDELGTETGIYVLITSLYVEPIKLNETVQIDDVYEFKSFGDETGETEWGEGTVQIKSLPENENDLYIEVEVKTNSPDDSFIGQTFYILKNAAVGNEIYPLYSDELGTETGIYVVIEEKIEPETEPETPCLILEFNGDSFSASVEDPFIYTNDIIIDWGDETIETYTDGELRHNYSESNNYIIKISGNITELKDTCFSSCTGLTSIDIPSSVTNIGDGCFGDCTGLTSIDIPSSVTNIGDSCFHGCTSLTSIDIPSSVTSLGSGCFGDCTGLTLINIPSSITNLGNSCFGGCTNLTSINIPSSVTSIGDSCFHNCTSLTSIDIPSSVTSLEYGCFSNCTSLASVNLNWTTSTTIITYNNLWFKNSNPQFIIPANTTDLYTDKSYPSDKIITIE